MDFAVSPVDKKQLAVTRQNAASAGMAVREVKMETAVTGV
jgi:hypothetical protein